MLFISDEKKIFVVEEADSCIMNFYDVKYACYFNRKEVFMETGKPSKPIGIIVSAIMFVYAIYAIYMAQRIWSGYSFKAEGKVLKIEGNFVPGNHIYVSQFSNVVFYEFTTADGKRINSKIDSLMLLFSRPESKIQVLYNTNSPEQNNIPVNSFYGYIVSAVFLIVLGSLLLKVSLSLT